MKIKLKIVVDDSVLGIEPFINIYHFYLGVNWITAFEYYNDYDISDNSSNRFKKIFYDEN